LKSIIIVIAQATDPFCSFENSLVEELKYNGFHRMRKLFDQVMSKEKEANQKFKLVVDAGCGTGLAGEVVIQICTFDCILWCSPHFSSLYTVPYKVSEYKFNSHWNRH
jgi:hypothetical protein